MSKPKFQFLVFIFIFSFSSTSCAEFSEVFGTQPESSQTPAQTVSKNTKKGRYYIVKKGDTIASIGQKFGVTDVYLREVNKIPETDEVTVKQKIYIPSHAELKENFVTLNEPQKVEPQEQPKFIWPINAEVTSGFGPRRGKHHDGIDIPSPMGTPVHASREGVVLFTGKLSGYGNLVIIKHSGNYFTAYGHLNVIKAVKNKKVKQGDVIGLVGRTGRAKTAHLHFEIRHMTESKDPLLFLPKK